MSITLGSGQVGVWRKALRNGVLFFSLVITCGCRARPIEGVECGRDADCGVGSACVELSCRPAAMVVTGRDAGSVPVGQGTLLDDFEQPSGMPRDARFGSWEAEVFSSEDCKTGQTGRADATLVDGQLDFDWYLSDTLDGKDCFPAAGVVTEPIQATVDLTAYERITFAMQYRTTERACIAAEQATISFVCEPAVYNYVFPVPLDWQTLTVPWTDFVQPDWVDPNTVSLEACLARAQDLAFEPVPNTRDGQCQAGKLQIDSIWLGLPPPTAE
jgi:hypothetical protein